MKAALVLKHGESFDGENFGAHKSIAGEVVFATGMVGYPQSLTDPSYKGQILVLTYPIIGSYGIGPKETFESDRIQISGLIVSNYIDTPSHFESEKTLGDWLKEEGIPGLVIKDTRAITQLLRDRGSSLGKIQQNGESVDWYDPNEDDLVKQVAAKKISIVGKGKKTILYIDCGGKKHMVTCLVERGARVVIVPYDFKPFTKEGKETLARHGITTIDGYVMSNGPGDPKNAIQPIATVKEIVAAKKPLLGICLGHQIITLAMGGNTTKLKFGHRGQNQPAIEKGTNRCFITTQNHGFAVSQIPEGYEEWFVNANDNSNEGIRHKTLPVMSVQFHPESTPGPTDTEWIFDHFLEKVLL